MNKTVLLIGLLFFAGYVNAQQFVNQENRYLNSAEKLLATDGRLTIGGYGEAHFNQPLGSETRRNGSLDVHRMVMLFGYRFNNRTQFITEIEYEHVKEVFIEQAFLQYRINNFIKFRAGLLLIPMGIINEYHEPTTFNGVERPLIDKYIAPSTWREIGFGFTGDVLPASLKYQVYVVNGFKSYDGSAKLSGKNGFRKGRQKGAESIISFPNITGKVEYYGIRGLNIGLSGYFGKTQSTLYDGIVKGDNAALAKADSSVVGISMLGADARYSLKGLRLRGQYYLSYQSNTRQYNYFTSKNGTPNDLGASMTGYYVEAGYNVFHPFDKMKTELTPFIRYGAYNMHNSVVAGSAKNGAYNTKSITTGLSWNLARGAVLKADLQFLKTATGSQYSKVFNAGFGVMF
ncbi:FIG00651834: hypothetical protein [hydrothermal vent metagenome]|uniref:Phosphate-selective porin O and P n=1 Tax=hydrothermal vent metagenome TaxID=652676 RepID=A0A3B0TY87_9ZZZZ